ncbi:MAG: N2,N2-dimethylguanosine tRNA methyltransferase [Candidatus Nanoarchaeia archaeon]|jgi:tRNA (guanine26-N2/guanine27-N2)-dimethyltransferase
MKYSEGKAVVNAENKIIPSKKDEVFLNEHKLFDRDIHVLLLNSLGWKNKVYLDLMSASGIRALRICKETKCFSKIILNDSKKSAVKNIKKNIELNLAKNCTIYNLDAYELLHSLERGVDAIDIDPFGSPIYFITSAIKKLSRNGILSICATDTAALSGTCPKTCIRRYHSKSFLSEFYYESGLRILVKECINLASAYDVALEPIFAHATRHYFRVYFRKVKGAKKADELMKQINYISYCPKCLNRVIGVKDACECKNRFELIGPLFIGQLYDEKIAGKMKSFGKYPDFFQKIENELKSNVPWFYVTDLIAKRHRLGFEPRIEKLGFLRTYINPKGFKTDKNIKEILKIFNKNK